MSVLRMMLFAPAAAVVVVLGLLLAEQVVKNVVHDSAWRPLSSCLSGEARLCDLERLGVAQIFR